MRESNYQFKVIVMSATLDTALYSDYFKPINDEIGRWTVSKPIYVGAKRFPVRKVYLDQLFSDQSTKTLFEGRSMEDAKQKHKSQKDAFSIDDIAEAAEDADIFLHVTEKLEQFQK
jgi:HrpA-like RNA helicase